jgi:hypothetical protein
MAESHLVSGLKNLRSEKLGVLQDIKEQIARLEAHAATVEGVITHIDGVLKDVAPDLDLDAVKPVRSRKSAKDDLRHDGSTHRKPVTQHVLAILREGGPATISEILVKLADARPGHDPKKLRGSASVYLAAKLKDGLVKVDGKKDGNQIYAINR